MGNVSTDDVAGYLSNNAWRYLEALEVLRQLLIGYRFSEEGRNAIYAIYTRRHRQAGGEEFKAARKIKDKTNNMRTLGLPSKKMPPNPNFPVQHVGDIIAMTAVCLYPSEIKRVRNFILSKRDEGVLEVYGDEEKKEKGYVAHHLVLGLREHKYAGIRCEVQLKTIVHDAWTAWTHDLTYKPRGRLPGAGGIKDHLKDLSDQLTAVESMGQRFRDFLVKEWDREHRRRETARLRLIESIMFRQPPPDDERSEAYLRIARDLRENGDTYRSGIVSKVLGEIRQLAGNSPDVYSSKLLLYLAMLRADDDLDYVAVDMIDEWVFRVDALERVMALNFKGLACYGLNRIPEAIDVTEKVLQEAESVPGGPFMMPRQNLAHYLAEMGGEPDGHVAERARGLADEARAIAESKDPIPPQLLAQLLDTLGFVKIVFGRSRSEIEEGIALCQQAYNLAPDDFKPASKGYLELHEEIAKDRLEEFPAEGS